VESKGKIFGIGLHKTGTSSLHEALKILGFKSIHDFNEEVNIMDVMNENIQKRKKLLEGMEHYDAFFDFHKYDGTFKKLDEQYPNSKFILNTRNLEDWLISREKHVKRNQKNPFYKGDFLKIDKTSWKVLWENYHNEVIKYFKNRPGDFLIIDVPGGEGWKKLCPFLRVSIPKKPFPKKNQSPK
jgi:hypothetical protein